MKPLISIIIPANNEEKNIGRCLDSLLSLEYPSSMTEIIVVDNNSTDDTPKIIRRYPVIYISEEKKGSYAARNKGISQAKGELIAFTDADCVVDRNWLNELIKGFNDPKVAGCGGKIIAYNPKKTIEKYTSERLILKQEESFQERRFSPPFILTANAIYRRDILERVGLFDPSFICGGDADLAWRVQGLGYEIKYLPEAVVWHKHRTNLRDLWRQMVRYGEGDVTLFRKYRTRWGKKLWVRWQDWAMLGYLTFKCVFFYLFNLGKKKYVFYDLLCRFGLIVGKVKSSLRYKVLVL